MFLPQRMPIGARRHRELYIKSASAVVSSGSSQNLRTKNKLGRNRLRNRMLQGERILVGLLNLASVRAKKRGNSIQRLKRYKK